MFSVRNLQRDKYLAVVTATSYESPLSVISKVTERLIEEVGAQNKGEIFFDLLCSNGLEWIRFLSMFFDGKTLLIDTARVVSPADVEQHIKDGQAAFFKHSRHVLNNSILTSDQIKLVLNG